MTYIKQYKIITALLVVGILCTNCTKHNYFENTGIQKSPKDENIMEYLNANPVLFDTLVQVIQLAGLEDVLKNDSVTFFAPADSSIRRSIKRLNTERHHRGRDSITRLSQISSDVWRTELSLYIFKGRHVLDDYSQLDLNEKQTFPGEYIDSYEGRIMNIGVIYNDAGGVSYAGYRKLVISYIPSLANPSKGWFSTRVASSNIKLSNGVIHSLQYNNHYFGFDIQDFIERVKEQ